MHTSGSVEVADIFRQHGPDYRRTHPLPVPHLRAMRAIEICRTSELGGHVDMCDTCGTTRISYNSCRNRHCPKCPFLRKEQWLEARNKDLLPIPYFHIVFTIPDDLNPLALRNPSVMYNILFQAVSETLVELARDPKHLGAKIGFISILHTWGQNLMEQHLYMASGAYCIDPGGPFKDFDLSWSPVDFVSLNGSIDPSKNKYHSYDPYGVTLYIKKGGGFTLNANNPTFLDAPTTGDYGGYLIILEGSRQTIPETCAITAGSDINFNGMVFAPYCNITVNGGSDSTAEINAQLIGWDLKIDGNNTINFRYDPKYAVKIKRKVGLVK